MNEGSIDIKLRPIKLAFLVDPKEKDAVLGAIKISSFLWGGAYNPIIPVFGRILPASWRRNFSLYGFNSKTLLAGYIDAYDPDFIVPLGKAAKKKFEIGHRKIITPEEILGSVKQEGTPHYGIGMFEILNDFFEKELKFVRKNPLQIHLMNLPVKHKLFLSSVFGAFPDDVDRVIRKRWGKELGAQETDANLENYSALMAPGKLFARRFTYHQLQNKTARGIRGGTCLFYLDAQNTLDVIDYWNLRAIGWTVIPIAKQVAHLPEVKKMAEDFIDENSGVSRHNPNIYIWSTIMIARSLDAKEIQAFLGSLNIPVDKKEQGSRVSMQHYPRIWDEWARDKDGALCCEVEAESKSVDFSNRFGGVNFKTLDPEFMSHFGGSGTPRFANEVEIKTYSTEDIFAEIIPEGGPTLTKALGGIGLEEWKFSKKAAVNFPHYTRSTTHISVPKAEEIFKYWMKDKGIDVELSSVGYVAKQMIKRLDGIRGIVTLGDEGMIDLLREMEDGKPMSKEAFLGKISKITSSGGIRNDTQRFLKRLMETRMFRLGAQIQCPICMQKAWYTIKDLNYKLQCPRCLDAFEIPSHSPDDIHWSYRTFGPFSLPRRAYGIYSTLLTLRVFSQLFRGLVTPIMSFTTKMGDADIEIDLGTFFRESNFDRDTEAKLIFAECKSHDDFDKKDVAKMAFLAQKFPGAVIVFATLKEALSAREKKLIRPLVNKGRRYWKSEEPYNPVLILTKTELFADIDIHYAWEKAGGKYKPFAERHYFHNQLIQICDATQQLHLDMKPWHDWLEEKRGRNRKRRKKVPSTTMQQGEGQKETTEQQ